jgi:hypothetical protein
LISINRARELVDRWWHFKPLHKDALLPLNADVLGPLHETGQIPDRLVIASNPEILGVLLE